jgi:hypothetical protein
MLEVDVTAEEHYDEERQKFVVVKSHRVRLEHSLVSVSKWESLWKVPFLSKREKSTEETLSYLQIMLVDDIPPEVWRKLVEDHLEQVKDYIADEMTATKIYTDPNSPGSREVITSELIYYWMISMKIPVEFERWHLNRLITLVRVINLKNSPKKKMSLAERKALNAQRKAKHNTRG